MNVAKILMYHAVCYGYHDNPNNIFTTPDLFEKHMSYLKKQNLRGVSLRELRKAESSSRAAGLIGLTFDDGYEDFLQYAVPTLKKFGFSATVFVLSGLLGGMSDWSFRRSPSPRKKLLDIDSLREVAGEGMEIGSHGITHSWLPSISPEGLEEELKSSRQVIGEILGEEVEGFCYPYGALNGSVVQATREAGYLYACSVTHRVEFSDYDLPRITVAQDSVLKLAVKLKTYSRYSATKRIYERIIPKSAP